MNKNKIKIVAIDGPAGSGKSTISSLLAQKLNWIYVNTGLLYRAVAFLCNLYKINVKESSAVLQIFDTEINHFRWDADTKQIFYNDQNITNNLYDESVGKAASHVSQIPALREKLIPVQRNLVLSTNKKGAIVEGRDIGTVIFPDADLKIFLTASLDERAKRRYHQLKSSNNQITIDQLKKELMFRDKQDSERTIAPLTKASNAIELDTTNLSIEQVVNIIIQIMKDNKII